MMREGTASIVRREDYTAPAYWIKTVDLTFDLDPAKTLVTSKMKVERNAAVPHGPLRLHGEELNLLRVLIDGESVSFRQEGHELIIDNAPDADFALEIRNTCAPEKNTQLSGLYTSGGGFFTQCEAGGASHQMPCFNDSVMNGSRSPSSTFWVLEISTLVRRSLMRLWSST